MSAPNDPLGIFSGDLTAESDYESYNDDFYDLDCNPPVRVYIDGEEIPVINKGVETQARTDGPMDINRVSDVYFPAEWQGVDIVGKINAFNPDENATNVWDPVDIKFIDPKSDEDDPNYITYHRGFPIGFGAGSKGSIERRLRVGDPGMLLNSTPFTGSYQYDANVGDVLDDLFDEFESQQNVFDVVKIAHIGEILNPEQAEDYDGEADTDSDDGFFTNAVDKVTAPIGEPAAELVDDFLGNTSTSFKSNRDTLQDVIEYITKRLDGEMYFVPEGDDPREIALAYDEDRSRHFRPEHLSIGGAKDLEDRPRVIQNNALYEIQPINSIKVRGETDRNVFDTIGDILPTGDEENTYPTATARHEELYRLTGEQYQPPVLERDATSIFEAENEAREELLDRIEGGGMGEITLYLFPHIEPYDTIMSQPACGHNIANDVGEIDYSVEEVTHKVGYEEDTGQMKMRTHLRVNTHTTSDDITIVDSGEETL